MEHLILLLYLLVAAVLVLFSIKCADYVDMLDKKTNLSGAFIGGVILAAVTSLPELITSISSIAIGNEGLIIGNVLGSDLFNLCIFGGLTAIFVKNYRKAKIGNSHIKTIICTLLAYVTTGAVLFFNIGSIPGVTINIASVIIVILYAVSCKFLAGDDGESDGEDYNNLTLKQVVTRFVLCALGLVIFSVIITYITDIISKQYNLGSSLAGALFLGVATSIPELASSISLVSKGNFNAMCGNVLGSNMFNYIIFSLADIIAFTKNVYVISLDSQFLIVFGIISTLLVGASLKIKEKSKSGSAKVNAVLSVLGILVLVSYVSFLVCSMKF